MPASSQTYEQIERLLLRVSNHKLLAGADPRELSEEAYERAAASELAPLKRLAAYRLAHLLLRAPSRAAEKRALELFDQAKGSATLGPLPAIYGLAVAHRLGYEHAELESRLAAALAELRPVSGPSKGLSVLQDPHFNLLELAVYTTGLPYEPLLGQGEVRDRDVIGAILDPTRAQAWLLVGHGAEARRYAGQYCIERVEALREEATLAFICTSKTAGRLWFGGKEVDAPARTLHLLALLLHAGTETVRDLAQKMESSEENYRQIKRQLRERVIALVDREPLLPAERGRAPRVAPEIDVIGAVPARLVE
jgi:hypothetical protein